MTKAKTITCLLLACPFLSQAQTASPARMVVTIGHHYGHEPPVLTRDDLLITTLDGRSLTITNLVPLRGERAGLELYVVVDNCSSCEAGSKFQELSRFIGSQPATTAVGVAYINNGNITAALAPTFDHERAVQALSAPTGSKPASPYGALRDLIAGWSTTSSFPFLARRAVVIVSNGMNPSATERATDPTAEAAIEAAQQAGVTVYAIYHPSADYATSDVSKIYDGQVQLAHVAHDTGGEAYFTGLGPLPSIAPFLADIADHLANQYLLEFEASAGFQDVTVTAPKSDIELMVPGKAWVPEISR